MSKTLLQNNFATSTYFIQQVEHISAVYLPIFHAGVQLFIVKFEFKHVQLSSRHLNQWCMMLAHIRQIPGTKLFQCIPHYLPGTYTQVTFVKLTP